MKNDQFLPFFKRAIKDMGNNRFLHSVSIITIAFSVLIVSSFILFFTNADQMIGRLQKEIRILVYLETSTQGNSVLDVRQRLTGLNGVGQVIFLPKDEAFQDLKQQMKRQGSIFEHLNENPLPDAFEVYTRSDANSWDLTERLARDIELMEGVESVEYGQKWLGKLKGINRIFRFVSFTMSCLFFMVTVFIIGNTIRLALYSRREEVEIMYIVGATERFIKMPFYLEGIILGAIGGITGLGILYSAYLFLSSNLDSVVSGFPVQFSFLPPQFIASILLCSTAMGWLGCYISLKQFLKI